jgi:lipopolysaccharide export system ATP-binding protein
VAAKGTLFLEGLAKSFGRKTAVREVTFTMESGEVVGLLGPNGAGKTTVFYMVVGFIRPTSGRIWLNGRDVSLLPMYKRARMGVSYLPQEPSVFRKLTVAENVLAVLENMPYTKTARYEEMERLLQDLGVTHLAKNKAHSLSGGERRRVEICRALATNPSFVLLDEPFAGIDPKAVMEIQKLAAILKARDIGILITDHNVQETLEITDRAYIINAGEILEEGTPAQIAGSEKARKIYLGEGFRLANTGH